MELDLSKFYVECVNEIHKNVLSFSQIEIYRNNELLAYGMDIVNTFISNEKIIEAYKDDPKTFYSVVAANVFLTGAAFAKAYNENPNIADFSEVAKDFYQIAMNHLKSKYSITEVYVGQIVENALAKILLQLEPYWSLENSVEYLMHAFVALYSLGMSVASYNI